MSDDDEERREAAQAPALLERDPEELLRGLHKVVIAHNLESSTRDGWVLRQVIMEDAIVGLDEPASSVELMNYSGLQHYQPEHGEQSQGGVPAGHRRRFVLAKRAKFLLVKDEQSALAAEIAVHALTRRKVNDLESAERDRVWKARDETALQAKRDAALKTAEEALAHAKADTQKEIEVRMREKESHRKLEADFAKVRENIGAIRLKEILGA